MTSIMRRKCKLCDRWIGDGDFYKGVPNAHKACHARRVRERRLANPEALREYDRVRNQDADRIAARKAYSQSERGKAVETAIKKRWLQRHPVERAAHVILGN